MLSLQCSTKHHHHHHPPRRHKPVMNPRPFISLSAAVFICILQLLFPAAISQPQKVRTIPHVFGPFDVSNYTTLKVIQPASIHFGALQITPDTAGNVPLTESSSGKPSHSGKTPEKLLPSTLHSSSTSIASTTPLPAKASPSSLPQPSTFPTNSTTDGSPDNHIVAVELDTVKQDFDPDDNHIGLNINSVKSKSNISLSQFGIQIAPDTAIYYVIWIDYNGSSKKINIFIKEQPDRNAPLVSKPEEPVLTSDLDLKTIVKQSSYFGFSGSTGITYQLNCVLRWNMTVEVLSENKNKSRSLKMGFGIGVPLMALILVGIGGSVYYVYRKREEEGWTMNRFWGR